MIFNDFIEMKAEQPSISLCTWTRIHFNQM